MHIFPAASSDKSLLAESQHRLVEVRLQGDTCQFCASSDSATMTNFSMSVLRGEPVATSA